MKRILLVEDELVLAKNIAFFLKKEGFTVEVAHDGDKGLEMAEQGSYDLLLLDWTLPKRDGLDICRQIRKQSAVAIMMITAKGDITDKVVGLELGADDYLVKPFHQRELLARIHALFRREARAETAANPKHPTYKGLILDTERLVMKYKEASVALSATEYKLLEVMLRHPDRVYARETLFELVWGGSAGYGDRTVDVTISRLRKKITELSDFQVLHAIRGIGYRFGEDT